MEKDGREVYYPMVSVESAGDSEAIKRVQSEHKSDGAGVKKSDVEKMG